MQYKDQLKKTGLFFIFISLYLFIFSKWIIAQKDEILGPIMLLFLLNYIYILLKKSIVKVGREGRLYFILFELSIVECLFSLVPFFQYFKATEAIGIIILGVFLYEVPKLLFENQGKKQDKKKKKLIILICVFMIGVLYFNDSVFYGIYPVIVFLSILEIILEGWINREILKLTLKKIIGGIVYIGLIYLYGISNFHLKLFFYVQNSSVAYLTRVLFIFFPLFFTAIIILFHKKNVKEQLEEYAFDFLLKLIYFLVLKFALRIDTFVIFLILNYIIILDFLRFIYGVLSDTYKATNITVIKRYEELEDDFAEMLHDDILQDLLAIKKLLPFMEKDKAIKQTVGNTLDDLNLSIRERMNFYSPKMTENLSVKENYIMLIYSIEKKYRENKILVNYKFSQLYLISPYEKIVYRILQELITNVFKHSKASKLDIIVQQDKDRIFIQVEDNGVYLGEKLKLNNGLALIKKQIDDISGEIIYEVNGNHGLRIRIEFYIDGSNSYEYFISR
ncbi:hypothetical protein FDF31_08515 [Clostridium sporogenes]|uniref:sensor histidine kinase n=1 Tax=Clostridium sp. LCP25S3_F10 TaxID=3438750 RepID=UPI0013D4C443|nr:hypothetical protein [Clostridium sporogenes]NFS25676.1 hypothetical protein [Clostridium sporogenes]